MELSAEQMHSFPGRDAFWCPVTLPVGRRPLPEWAKGLHVYWADGYGNAPSFTLRTDRDLRTWDNKRFEFDERKGMYVARSGDGRAEVYHHGAPRWTTLKRWDREEKAFVEYEGWATPQDEGLGGSGIHITLTDGRDVVLRGPWCSSGPMGYLALAYVDPTAAWRGQPRGARSARPWWQMTAMSGLFLLEDVFLPIFARFLPHLELAYVERKYSIGPRFYSLEPLKPEWDAPKDWMLARERAERTAAA